MSSNSRVNTFFFRARTRYPIYAGCPARSQTPRSPSRPERGQFCLVRGKREMWTGECLLEEKINVLQGSLGCSVGPMDRWVVGTTRTGR